MRAAILKMRQCKGPNRQMQIQVKPYSAAPGVHKTEISSSGTFFGDGAASGADSKES